jgi:transcription antitermination factor NusG
MRLDQPWNPVRYAPGVYSLLAIDGIPSICPDAAVDALRAGDALRAMPPPPATASWAPGALCSPANGIFRGHRATVLSVHHQTARIAVMFLGHLREISLHVDCLMACEDA